MLNWNCCGLGNTATVQEIRELHQQASLDIIFLMETKNPDAIVLKELNFLSLMHRFLVPPERPSSGGLALFWRQDINLQILSSSKMERAQGTLAAFRNFIAICDLFDLKHAGNCLS
ncbi:hypothetical protein N665_0048s0006 [Sinapis alba]|nr:hypothetical protein N665_0048s0006 [Sinapis alba]